LSALAQSLRQRLTAASRSDDPQWVATVAETLTIAAKAEGERWLPWLSAIESAVDDDVVFAADNAMCAYYGAVGNLRVHRPGAFHFPSGFGTLGFTVPVAVGAAIAAPDHQIVGITGDGGLLFTVPELAVAAAEKLSMSIVVFDNSGYGEIRAEMLERGHRPTAVQAPVRDLVLLSQSLGAHAEAIESPAHLSAAISAARHRSGPSVFVVAEPSERGEDER
jgi:acetolactate synthase-1/2/3 large subunit